MPRPKLLLHIGTHKTGTTAFQRYLFENVDALADSGIIYPPLPEFIPRMRRCHHYVASAFDDLSKETAFTEDELADYLAHLAESARPGQTLLLSSERFWRGTFAGYKTPRDRVAAKPHERKAANRLYVEHVERHLKSFDTHILVSIRPQDDFLLSLYRGACASRLKTPFPKFLENQGWLTDYSALLSNWSEAFGPDRVCVRRHEAGQRGEAGLQRMVDGFGLNHRVDVQSRNYDQRVSPSHRALAEILRIIELVSADQRTKKTVKDHAMSTLAAPDAQRRIELLFTSTCFDLSLDISPNAANEAVRRQFFPRHKGLLFDREVREEIDGLVPANPEGIAAEVYNLFRDAGFGQAFDNPTQLQGLIGKIADEI